MEKTWTIKRATPEDREKIFALYDQVHGKTKGDIFRTTWAWEYENNPHNPRETPAWLAEENGNAVGLYASIPVAAKRAGADIQASWSVDLMTHPDYRGQGIFQALTNRMLEDSKADGVSLFLVLPNGNSGPIMRRRGWQDLQPFPIMIKGLRIWPLLKKVTFKSLPKVFAGGQIFLKRSLRKWFRPEKQTSTSTIHVSEINSFDERFNEFFERAATPHDFVVVRNQAYLNWRYVDCPHKSYTLLIAEDNGEVLGYIVTTMDRQNLKNGFIVDFLIRPGDQQEETMACLLREAEQRLRQRKAVFIESLVMDEPYRTVMQNLGFAEFPATVFWNYDLVGYTGDGETFKDIRSWFISRGDADSDIAQ